jgi:hypothetical protein
MRNFSGVVGFCYAYKGKSPLWPHCRGVPAMSSRQFQCRDCGGLVGYRSRRRGFVEKCLLPLLLLRPVRCGDCFRRSYRPLFVPVRERGEAHVTDHAAA